MRLISIRPIGSYVMCRFSLVTIVFLLSLVSGVSDTYACGESLFRVGKGVNYREYTAPLPGNIIVVANTEGELFMAERIAAAGHHVKVISSADEISETLDQEDFDIVLALYKQRDIVESEINRFPVTYLPVATEGSIEQKQARDSYKESLSTDDSVKQFLKTIHKTLKERQV
jgi:hypothetical protein